MVMIVGLVPVCGQVKAIKGGPLEVGVLWEEGSPWYDLVKSVGDSMEKDYPGTKVTYTFNNTAARPAVETRMKAGNPLDVDILFDGVDANSYGWVDQGYVLDLTSAMNLKRADGTTWKSDFNPLFLPSMTYKGKIYAAGQQVYVWLLHYNKKMFDDWGLTPPKTWDDMLKLCATIKGKGVAPIAVTGQVNFYVGMWWDSLVQRLVGTQKVMEYLYGTKGTKVANDPAYIKATDEMMKLVNQGYLIDGWQGTDFTTNQVYFFQGKAAMILMGSWLMTEMKDSIPAGFQMAVAPFPSVGGQGKQDAMFGKVESDSVAAKSKNPELAVEFLRRFTSKTISQQAATQLGSMSPLRDVTAPVGITGADKVLKDAETAEFVLYNFGLGTAKYGAMAAWYDPIVEMWTGKLTPKQALAKIDANMEAVRAQRKAGQ
jgi:raffinose/stachyose/melibiose transport system substrate-binding protein